MAHAIAYITVAITFGAIDFVWLSYAVDALYKPMFGDLLLQEIRWAPAIAFYALFVFGIVYFAVRPALKSQSLSTASVNGLLYGAVCYGTYDLTNFATLTFWTLHVTIIDLAYGAAISCVCATLAYLASRRFYSHGDESSPELS